MDLISETKGSILRLERDLSGRITGTNQDLLEVQHKQSEDHQLILHNHNHYGARFRQHDVDLEELDTRLQTIEQTVATAPVATAPVATGPPTVAAEDARIAELEQKVATSDDRIEQLEQTVAALQATVQDLLARLDVSKSPSSRAQRSSERKAVAESLKSP